MAEGNAARPLVLEPLEDRRLLSSIQEYSALLSNNTNGGPTQLVISNGDIWFTEPTANTIGVFNTTTNSVSHQIFTTATNANPPEIAATTGPHAAIWFSVRAAGNVGMSNPSNPSDTPTISTFFSNGGPLPSTVGIAVDSANNLWLTAPAGNELIEIAAGSTTPTLTTVVPVSPSILGFQNFDSAIITGPGGTLYFTEATTNAGGTLTASGIGSYNPTTGTFSQILLPTAGGVQKPSGLALGPDGNIWFTESVPNAGGSGFVSSAVGVINVNNGNSIKEFSTPAGSQPSGITAGPDGNVWFTETGAGAVGFVNVAGLSNPSEYTLGGTIAIPTAGHAGGVLSNPAPVGITAGTDGRLWFADKSGAIGVLTPTHFVVTTQPRSPVSAGGGFGFTVKAEDSSGNVDTGFNGTVTVSLVNNPGGSSSILGGSSLTVTAVNGVATFSGLTINVAASGYTLQATSAALDAPTHVVTNGIDVTQSVTPPPPPPPPPAPPPPPPVPPPPTILSEVPVITQKRKANGKPVGKAALSGYTITFSTAMDQTALMNHSSYEVDVLSKIKKVVTKVGKKRVSTKVPVYKPIGFSVTNVTSSSVTVTLAGKQTFPKGGKLTVFAADVDNTSQVFMSQNGVWSIGASGKRISRLT